ncbi:hypothetical protein FA95DRAFT_1217217 [Auriscalpium vulgare]|uniref:Uncharacterized protein n=1 Tax=Auriscalpium vulgare TaxID=40419 RepID=A0ACB8R3G4_9AGAM|nr:hypothetical protein FA95DRAFT_1217217 [Auriscalpium vulgare]
MPLALLNSEYWDGKIARTYYHDLESFVWVLVFEFLSFGEDGERLKEGPRPADAWETGDYEECRKEKLAFVSGGMEKEDVAKAWKDDWPLAYNLLRFTARAWANRQTADQDIVLPGAKPVQVIDPTSDDTYYEKVIYLMKYFRYPMQ